MKQFRTAKEADICLLLEGTYPFVTGGVSNWVYELIKFFPTYRFAIVFLGTKESDYSEFKYPLLDNVVHLQAHYLFEEKSVLAQECKEINPETMEKLRKMHDKFKVFHEQKFEIMSDLFELINQSDQVNDLFFLRSKSAWQMITERYASRCSDQSFFDYFWVVRNFHHPFWEIKKIPAQLPHVKMLHSASTGYAGFLGALLQKKYNLPYLLTEHGIYTKERWIELVRNYFLEYILKQHKTLTETSGILDLWTSFFSILAKIAYQAANPIVSLFEAYRQRQITDGAREERTRIIPYGIDFAHYQFSSLKTLSIESPIIACVARVVPIKDIKTFIKASALIIKAIPNAQAWIVGSTDADPEYYEVCQNLIAAFGLQQKIKFLGYLDVMEVYPKIDLLIISSISEGTPFTILECFAVGVPVVATDVGGCVEMIYGKNKEDQALGKAGAIVNLADAEALAKASVELLTNVSLWKKSQTVGLERVRTYYNMDLLVKQYGEIYAEGMKCGGNRV